MDGPAPTMYRPGTARNDVSSSNPSTLGEALLETSASIITTSLLQFALEDVCGPCAHIFTVYTGQAHAADLTHTDDTTLARPSAPMVRTNNEPSSPSTKARLHGEPGRGKGTLTSLD